MRPGQPPDRIVRGSLSSAFPPLGAARRRYWSDSAHWECHFYQVLVANSRFEELLFCKPLRWPAAQPAQRAGSGGGRNAQGNQHALARISDFPWRFTLENRQLPPASPQSIVRQALRVPTFSVNPLWARRLRAATEKHLALVQKLWTIVLPCGMLRKTAVEFVRRKL